MIDFACHYCREPLSVPTDLAGGDVQCPRCGRLASVPLLSDLPNLGPDGTHRIAPLIEREEDRLADLIRAFGRRRVDDDGEEIDNRTLPDVVDLAPMPSPPARFAPRYDPETGERLDPFELRREAPLPAVPLGPLEQSGMPVPQYATPGKTEYAIRQSVWIELFTAGNAFVIMVIFIAHLIWAIVDMLISGVLTVAERAGGPSLASWPMNLFLWLALAHYANVIFEIGEEEQESLPRPLRDLSLGEDVFQPLARFLVAFVLCYAPAWFASYLEGPMTAGICAILLVAGGFVFPAALMSTCGSNTLSNLRPDRLVKVMRADFWAYLRLAILTTLTVPLYAWSVTGMSHFVLPLVQDTPAAPIYKTISQSLGLRLPIMFLVVVLAHGICWRLGQLQRLYRGVFDWAWEAHEAERLADRRHRQAEREAAMRAPRQA